MLLGRQGRDAEALQWLKRAAEQRADPDMAYRLAIVYEGGFLGASVDMERAQAWYALPARRGCRGSQQAAT